MFVYDYFLSLEPGTLFGDQISLPLDRLIFGDGMKPLRFGIHRLIGRFFADLFLDFEPAHSRADVVADSDPV